MVTTIEYQKLAQILTQTPDIRTKALIAFQYASGCRIGELLPYNHKDGHTTNGLLKRNIEEIDTPIGKRLSWQIPNFKVKKVTRITKIGWVYEQETEIFQAIKQWLAVCSEQVFELREARARELIRNALGKYPSHTLRRSRGTQLVNDYGLSAYDVMEYLGHTSLESTRYYISTSKILYKFEDYFKRKNTI